MPQRNLNTTNLAGALQRDRKKEQKYVARCLPHGKTPSAHCRFDLSEALQWIPDNVDLHAPGEPAGPLDALAAISGMPALRVEQARIKRDLLRMQLDTAKGKV